MKAGLVGPTDAQRSLPLNAERTVNLFVVMSERGKEQAALYGTPGLSEFADAGTGPVRQCFASSNGRAFMVSGSELYEVDENGTTTSRGTLDQSTGNVTMDENFTQLGICDGTSLYVLTYDTNNFAKVTDPDLPECSTLTVIDSYFVVNKKDSGEFYISAVGDGTSWDALDFATAESSPDKLKRVFAAVGQLWLFGDKTTEPYTNTGSSAFPFERIANTTIEAGIMAPHTVVAMDNSVFGVGQDEHGSGIVYRARGFSPKKISTPAIDRLIQNATDKENMRAWSYQQDGQYFYVITGGGLETSLVYDLVTQQWHERAFLNEEGDFEQHLGNCHMFAFGKNLVGSRVDGKLYELSLDVYTDGGEEIRRERTFTHLSEEDTRIRVNTLEIAMETGVGIQGEDDPVISLQVSKDMGRTYSDAIEKSYGAAGEYSKKVAFRRIGIAENLTFKVSITSPTKVALLGGYLK